MKNFVVITDRGGHLHDALRLLDQLNVPPAALLTTEGPDVDHLKQSFGAPVLTFPLAFSWIGKQRVFNPFKLFILGYLSFIYAVKLRPSFVFSTGASDVVPFCYFAKMLGAKIYHIENLAQVVNASVTGRLLYPICTEVFVQWEELLAQYGPKARYQGWVL